MSTLSWIAAVPDRLAHSPVLDQVTTAAAAGAIVSPIWLPWLAQMSELCALVAPILGVLWLLVQIWAKVRRG